jgi:hypothetical protein
MSLLEATHELGGENGRADHEDEPLDAYTGVCLGPTRNSMSEYSRLSTAWPNWWLSDVAINYCAID